MHDVDGPLDVDDAMQRNNRVLLHHLFMHDVDRWSIPRRRRYTTQQPFTTTSTEYEVSLSLSTHRRRRFHGSWSVSLNRRRSLRRRHSRRQIDSRRQIGRNRRTIPGLDLAGMK